MLQVYFEKGKRKNKLQSENNQTIPAYQLKTNHSNMRGVN